MIGSFRNNYASVPQAEINVVPLVDVMLVLLVIFIITAPLLTNAVNIDLPTAQGSANVAQQAHAELAIRKDGSLWWNGEAVGQQSFQQRLAAAAATKPVPELHIHADRHAEYGIVASAMADASRAGIVRIGFITSPSATLKKEK